MITPQQFKQSWESVADDHLVAFPADSLSDVHLSPEVRTFLIDAGLPTDAAPFLNFGPPKSGSLARASVVWHQPSEFDRYRIIGGNGSGDPVCLDEETGGQVVYLNHDNRFERVLMASSVPVLAECLLQLRDAIASAGGNAELIRPAQFEALVARFRAIDPLPSGDGGYWQRELQSFQKPPSKAWWRFWK